MIHMPNSGLKPPYDKLYGLISIEQNVSSYFGSGMRWPPITKYPTKRDSWDYKLTFINNKEIKLLNNQFDSLVEILNKKKNKLSEEETEDVLMIVLI